MSQQIDRHTSLDVPALLARRELMRVMTAIHEHQAPFEEAALHVGLRDLHVPGHGDVGVAIEANLQERPLQFACGIVIAASSAPELFPRFLGTISVSALGAGASELWLQGRYEVPFGGIGAAIDATLLNGAAERALDRLLNVIAQAVTANVKREQEFEIGQRAWS